MIFIGIYMLSFVGKSPLIKMHDYWLFKSVVYLKLLDEILVWKELFTKGDHIVVTHYIDQKYLKRIAVKVFTVYIRFSALNFRQYFICMQSQRTVIANSVHLVTLYLMVHHHLDNFLAIFNDLCQGHVDMDATQYFWFEVNLLNIL